jgi:RHS repeat-associated protein
MVPFHSLMSESKWASSPIKYCATSYQINSILHALIGLLFAIACVWPTQSQAITLNADGSVSATGNPQISTQYGPRPDSEFSTGTLFVKTKNSNNQDSFAYLHHDHLQTPLQATDKAGNVVWAASYNAFGKASITTPAASAANPTIHVNLRLPGQYLDEETGLHYNYRRYYDADSGRYVTQDPIGVEGGINQYKYASADPVNMSDPTGECPMCAAYAVCVAQCMLEDVASNTVAGECNNFGDSAKNCAASCLLGPLGRLAKWAKKAPSCPINSFPADTLVHVKPKNASGYEAHQSKADLKPISALQVGDEVLALSEWKTRGQAAHADERLSYEKISDVFTSHKLQTLVHITLNNGQTIQATEGHPFKTTDGWRDAIMLKKGGKLLLKGSDGEDLDKTLVITDIGTEQKVLPVFNLEVANAHTFFVGTDGELVHNTTCKIAKRKVERGQGPSEIKRIDGPEPSVPGSQWHAHSDKTKNGKNPALNQDGSPHDGMPNFSNKTMDWLRAHGWK